MKRNEEDMATRIAVDIVAAESGDADEYKKFFEEKLKKYKVKSPGELSDADKKKFFNEVDKDWKSDEEGD